MSPGALVWVLAFVSLLAIAVVVIALVLLSKARTCVSVGSLVPVA
jgi:hypothetical protein